MFSTEGILKEIAIKEKQEEINSTFSLLFSGCVDSFSQLPEASKTDIGKIYMVHNKNECDMYVCTGLVWEKLNTISAFNNDIISSYNNVDMTLNMRLNIL